MTSARAVAPDLSRPAENLASLFDKIRTVFEANCAGREVGRDVSRIWEIWKS